MTALADHPEYHTPPSRPLSPQDVAPVQVTMTDEYCSQCHAHTVFTAIGDAEPTCDVCGHGLPYDPFEVS